MNGLFGTSVVGVEGCDMQRRCLIKASAAGSVLLLAGCASPTSPTSTPKAKARPTDSMSLDTSLDITLDIKQGQQQTTLMGVVRGVADYFGLAASDATLFGATGHAFVLSINDTVGQGGPYIWNRSHFIRLAKNLGIEMTDLGFYSPGASAAERATVEATLRAALDAGIPCSLVNMEHQLITGYDATGFVTAGPWPWNTEFPPRHLTFGGWDELANEIHMNFYVIGQVEPSSRAAMVRDSLEYAVDLTTHPDDHAASPAFAIAQNGYDNWLVAIDEHGSSHGNWWNGVVWGECRRHAGLYMREVARWFPDVAAQANTLATDFDAIAAGLTRASDRAMAPGDKKVLVAELKDRELGTVQTLRDILRVL